mgnify:CR=1 FL=1
MYLQRYLCALEKDPKRSNRFRRRPLCQTLAGNNCDLLTITSFACDAASLKARKGVVITARVHPGESNSSYMMKGVIDYLTGPSLDAKILRIQDPQKALEEEHEREARREVSVALPL